MTELKAKAVELNMMRKNALITSFKASPEAPYGTVIKVLDILNQAEGEIILKLRQEDPNIKRSRKFAFVKMTKEEEDKLRGM
jgi:biopolymer transport protein ExbD